MRYRVAPGSFCLSAAALAAVVLLASPLPGAGQELTPDADPFPLPTPVLQSDLAKDAELQDGAAGAEDEDPEPVDEDAESVEGDAEAADGDAEPVDRATGPQDAEPVSLRDASRPDRWLGVEARDVRWAPDGSGVLFRWHPDPEPDGDPQLDPWLFVDADGQEVQRVPDGAVHRVPAADPSWSDDGRRAAWTRDGRVYVYDAEAEPHRVTWDAEGRDSIPEALARVRTVFSGPQGASAARVSPDGAHVDFTVDETLVRHRPDDGSVHQLTRRHDMDDDPDGDFAEWLRDQQLELLEQHREDLEREEARTAHERALEVEGPQPIPVESGARISDLRLSPDGRFVTFQWTRPAPGREMVQYADYAARSGYTEIHQARPKAGEPRDENRFGVVEVSPETPPDEVEVQWMDLPEAADHEVVAHGPWWSPDGERAVVQVLSRDHENLWIAELDPASGEALTLVHDRDPAWLGGPPPQAGQLRPGLLEWLDEDRFVFASERTGWSHLHRVDLPERSPPGSRLEPLDAADPREAHAAEGVEVEALTEGEWEVRHAELSPDRTSWILTGSRQHPSDDHAYVLPAEGGELKRVSEGKGRFTSHPSPTGDHLAVLHSHATALPDLYLREMGAEPPTQGPAEMDRVTKSGSDAYHERTLVPPEMVSFEHPDGDPVWAALFLPPEPNEERAAVMHIHGGGYRQFAHRGWSVYGWEQHVGFINHLLAQGYVVLDFDYRGSSGFGRDYRTDIYRAMGHSDVDGAVAGVDWLAREHGVDPDRVGIYGLSYGGFLTLMALFRHPGVFAAGVSDDGVTDWAHYSDGWTTRILNRPQDDPEAYARSSPIHHAEGLEDPLLISHGVIDDNVHFQDAARLVQRLIELEKGFDVMYYPLERHGFRTESSRYDYLRRVDAHFRRHLLEPSGAP